MKLKFFLIILAFLFIVNPILASADTIYQPDENFAIKDSNIEGSRYKFEFKFDNDGSGADSEDKKINCSWYEFWEWLDEDGECQIESYDTIYDKESKETVIDWSMFKLQKKDKDWVTPLIKDQEIIYNKETVSKIIEYEDKSILNVTYILNGNDIKWLLNITAGTDGEYRLKFRVKSDNIVDYGDTKKYPKDDDIETKIVGIGTLIYDWNDIVNYTTDYTIGEGYFEQYTLIGTLKANDNIEIDPVITTNNLVNNDGFTNLLIDSSGNLWYVAKNSTDVLIFSNISGSWALNTTANIYFSSSSGFASAITTDDVIWIADCSGATTKGRRRSYNTISGSWGTLSMDWQGQNQRIAIDQDDNIFVHTANYSDGRVALYYKNATAWYSIQTDSTADADTEVRAIATSQNFTLVLYMTTASGTNVEMRAFDKDTWAWDSASEVFNGHTPNSADMITTDYDNNEMLGCVWGASAEELTCNAFNGTYPTSEKGFDFSSVSGINQSDTFSLARTDTSLYAFFTSISQDEIYVIKANNTDLISDDGTVMNLDWDIDFVITLPYDVGGGFELNFANLGNSPNYFAFENSSSITVVEEFPMGLEVDVYDEDTGSRLTNWSITITNELSTTWSASNVDSYYNDTITGNVTIHIEKDGYAERYYYGTDLGYLYLTAYLLNYSESQLTTFQVNDPVDIQIPNANITIERLIDGNWTLVAQRITGVTGLASFYLDPDVSYRITTSADGYTTYTFIDVMTETSYIIRLSQTYSTWSSIFSDIANYRLMPTYPTYRVNQFVNNTYTVASPNGNLTDWGMNITSWNGTVLYSNTSNVSTGGQMFYNKNWTATDCNFTTGCNFTALVYINTANASFTTTKTYYITNTTSGAYSLVNIVESITGLGENKSWYMMFFILLISAFIGSMMAMRYGAIIGSATAELIMGVAVYFQWFDLGIYIVNLLVLGAVLYAISNVSSE